MGNVTNDLPTGWISTRLGDLYSFEYGKSLIKGSRASAGKYPVYGSSGIVGMHDQFLIDGPAIIVGRKGAAGSVNYSTDNLWPIDTTYYVRDDKNLCLKFSYYLFRSLNLAKLEASTAIPGLNRNHAYDEAVLLPPLNEQHRIVAKIEELFSELDKGIENLKTARAQLKVYRQALLKQAFEGKLTAQWRAEHQGKLETADALLKRIQQERAQRYQQQLADWQTSGGSKPKAPKPLPPLTAAELAELPELPEGWVYTRVGALIDDPAYGTSKKCDYETDGLGVLRIPNVISGKVDATDLKFAQFTPDEVATYKLSVGDILIIRSNGSVSIVGRCALVSDADVDYLYAGYLIRLRPHLRLVEPWFLLNTFSLHAIRKQIEQKAKSTSGVNNINTGEIQSLVVALCGIEEQKQIQMEIEARLSEVDQLELTITTSLQQAEALRQSILKKAFSGQLVAQDPHDEPASALLARIKAERAEIGNNAASPRRTKKVSA